MSDISIPDGALLKIANNILNLLDYPSELEREEDLYSDDFYIAIIGNLISDRKFDIKPGNTLEEKVKSLKKLINMLSEIIDMDLSHIDAEGIIMNNDKISTKCLLELIEELIKALINENEESESSNKNTLSQSDNKIHNISDDNVVRKNRLMDLENESEKIFDKDDEINMDMILRNQNDSNLKKNENEKSNNKQVQKSDLNNINIHTNSNLENSNLEKSKIDDLNLDNLNSDNLNSNNNNNNESSIIFGNRSCFEALDFEKVINENNKSKDNSYIRKTFTQNDISRYERALAESEAIEQLNNENNDNENNKNENNKNDNNKNLNIDNIKDININKDEINKNDSSKNNKNSNEISNEKPIMNVSNISNNIIQNNKNDNDDLEIPNLIESSEKKKNYDKNEDNFDNFNNLNIDESDNYFNESNIKAYSVPNEYMKKPEISISGSEDLDLDLDINKDDKNNIMIENSSTKKKQQKTKESSNSNFNISLDKSSKKNTNRKNDINIKENSTKNSNKNLKTSSSKNSQSDISKSSIQSNQKIRKTNSNSKKNINNEKENKSISYIDEIPISDEEFKIEIMKEIRRLYGNNINKIFSKNKKKNEELFEIILKNIKIAREKILKSENKKIPDPDDLLTREFIKKYQKEIQYIINYYKNEKQRRNNLQDKTLKSITQNIYAMKKIQELQDKEIENEIEKKKQIIENKNHKNQLKLCNEIYSQALEFEKEKYFEELMNENELKRIENEAKTKNMMEIEKYYTDKIAILKEILKREKKEKEIERFTQKQFLENISKLKKGEFKKQIDLIFQKFDEEDKKNEVDNHNQEQIEKILNSYYKNK